jgi:hypothetical protein
MEPDSGILSLCVIRTLTVVFVELWRGDRRFEGGGCDSKSVLVLVDCPVVDGMFNRTKETVVAACLQEISLLSMPPSRDEEDASSASICAPLGSLFNVADFPTNSIANLSIDVLNDIIFSVYCDPK